MSGRSHAGHAVTHRFDDAEAYEQFMGRWSLQVGSAFLAWLRPLPAAHWLDVGCGTGIFTELIAKSCAPASVVAVDPVQSQLAHARNARRGGEKARFQLADAQALPFPDASFHVVASALVMNFVPDKARAMSEMRRVARPDGLIAAYVWDFAAELSPSAPLRRAMRRIGVDPPPIPGTDTSKLAALVDLFENAGLTSINATTIKVAVSFSDFHDFWLSQTPRYAPTTEMIDAMSPRDRQALMEAVRADLGRPPHRVEYSSRANAVRGHCPGGPKR